MEDIDLKTYHHETLIYVPLSSILQHFLLSSLLPAVAPTNIIVAMSSTA